MIKATHFKKKKKIKLVNSAKITVNKNLLTSLEGFSTYSPIISLPDFVHGKSATASCPMSCPE